MLKQRVITALVLLGIVLLALWAPSPMPFVALALLMLGAGAWEWARLNGLSGAGAMAMGLGVALCCVAAWASGGLDQPLPRWWLAAGFAWLLGGAVLLFVSGVSGWPRIPAVLRWLAGGLMLFTAWLAVAHSRLLGINYLLSALALVWAADIAAYFAGRAFGGRLIARKLAPSISPNKSWEGVMGGMLGALLLAALWVGFDRHWGAAWGWSDSLYSRLLGRGGTLALIGGVVALAAMSVVGDLIESLVKRSAGAKDSSGLLPGHGGVLDRVDALLPTLPIALALITPVLV